LALSVSSSTALATAAPGLPAEQVSQIHLRAVVDVGALGRQKTPARSGMRHLVLFAPGPQHWAAGAMRAQMTGAKGSPRPSKVVMGGQTHTFNGISGNEQETAGTGKYKGTGEVLEPPDQALCSNGHYVLESVNVALRVFSAHGKPLTSSILLSQFFHRAAGGASGPTDFISDPRCVYDSTTHRWFVTILDLTSNPAYPNFTRDQNFIAVSKTSNPTGKWNIYSFDVTDNGMHGSPMHKGCAGGPAGAGSGTGCLGDQPNLGFDRYGVYITDNEYAFAEVFPVAPPVVPPLQQIPVLRSGVGQMYALSKQQLMGGRDTTLVRFDTHTIPFPGPKEDSPWQSISPATAVPHSTAEPSNGVEYFLSDVGLPVGHRNHKIVVWAWTNTKTLGTRHPKLKLQHKIIRTARKGDTFFAPDPSPPSSQPFAAYQKRGPHPVAKHAGDPEEYLNANDDRMNWVLLSRGTLWTNVNTLLPPSKPGARGFAGQNRVGIMYFQVKPSLRKGVLTARTIRDGYVDIADGNVLFGTIGPRADGVTVMGMSLAGMKYFPSAAWTRLDGLKPGAAPVIHIAQKGAAPEDGFTGLGTAGQQGGVDVPPCGPCVARWGDYSETEVAPNGCIWGSAEDVPSTKHDKSGQINWGTGVFAVCPPVRHTSRHHHGSAATAARANVRPVPRT
jgi:hypothetical protein